MFRVVLAAVALAALAASPSAAAPRARKPRPPSAVEVVNQRKTALQAFELATRDAQDKPLAKIAAPLASGAQTRLRIAHAKSCVYVARWKFEDAGDEAEVDLCNDAKIVLTD